MFATPLATTFPSRPPAEDLPRFVTEFSAGTAASVAALVCVVLLVFVWRRPRKATWALSVAWLVLLTVLWARSHWRFDRVFISHGNFVEVAVSGGQAFVTWSDAEPPPQERTSLVWWSRPQGSVPSIPSGRIVYAGWRQLGFGAETESSFYGGVPAVFRRAVVPLWFPICLSLAWPARRLVAWTR